MIESEELLEWVEYVGNFYGILCVFVIENIE